QAQATRNVDGPFGAASLHVQAVALDLDVEVRAEGLGEPLGEPRRLVQLVLEDGLAELAGGTAAEANQAVLVRGQQFLVDPGDIMIAIEEGERRHLDEIAESGAVARQECQVVACLAAPPRLAVCPPTGSDVSLVPNDRVQAGGPALPVEFD